VALDGKSIAAACEAGARATPLHLVSAWAAEHRLVLGQRRAVDRSEVTAALELVALLDLTGVTLTADALHGTRAMTAAVRDRGGNYALALKGNRGPLYHAARELMATLPPEPAAETVETAHGRNETRRAWVSTVPPDWPARFKFKDLAAIARIDASRQGPASPHQTQTRYFVLSEVLDPADALTVIRTHWRIENTLHWVLDVVFDEDRSRARKDNAGENLAILRRLALNLLQNDPYRASIRRKLKRAGWDDAYLLSLLAQMR
jgi:predicted transposase YbfD/YdcC